MLVWWGRDPVKVAMKMARELRHACAELAWAASSRVFATSLTWIVPRSRKRWVLIGREHGLYLDNAKHFFAWLHGNLPADHQVCWLGERRTTLERVEAAGARTGRYPGLKSLFALLRAGTVVADSADFIDHGRIGWLRGARLVQIWHGAPLKEIELALYRRRLARSKRWARGFVRLQKRILRRYAPCDVLVSTSTYFADRAFAPCFAARRIVSTGYPRNDVLLGGDDYPAALVAINTDRSAASRLAEHRADGGRVILYAPTFREDRSSPFSQVLPLDKLAQFAQDHGALIALKLHPFMSGRYSVDRHEALVDISADSDIYPLLRDVDVLVTDYSSLYFDYLLLDRPIVFFPYDYGDYAARERHLLFDYEAMTPGPKAYDMDGLMAALSGALEGNHDGWKDERARVRALVHDHVDGCASHRLWQVLECRE